MIFGDSALAFPQPHDSSLGMSSVVTRACLLHLTLVFSASAPMAHNGPQPTQFTNDCVLHLCSTGLSLATTYKLRPDSLQCLLSFNWANDFDSFIVAHFFSHTPVQFLPSLVATTQHSTRWICECV
eukprot:Gb_37618 [translate_table: standard]